VLLLLLLVMMTTHHCRQRLVGLSRKIDCLQRDSGFCPVADVFSCGVVVLIEMRDGVCSFEVARRISIASNRTSPGSGYVAPRCMLHCRISLSPSFSLPLSRSTCRREVYIAQSARRSDGRTAKFISGAGCRIKVAIVHNKLLSLASRVGTSRGCVLSSFLEDAWRPCTGHVSDPHPSFRSLVARLDERPSVRPSFWDMTGQDRSCPVTHSNPKPTDLAPPLRR
jgi:hypothetical protein